MPQAFANELLQPWCRREYQIDFQDRPSGLHESTKTSPLRKNGISCCAQHNGLIVMSAEVLKTDFGHECFHIYRWLCPRHETCTIVIDEGKGMLDPLTRNTLRNILKLGYFEIPNLDGMQRPHRWNLPAVICWIVNVNKFKTELSIALNEDENERKANLIKIIG